MPLWFFRQRNHHQVQDLLMSHADALVAGTLDWEALIEQYGEVITSQVQSLLRVAERVSRSLDEITPSERFVDQLRLELRDPDFAAPDGWWERLRQLSPRTQIAAGIGIGGVAATLAAGVMFLVSRRSLADLPGFGRNRRTVTA